MVAGDKLPKSLNSNINLQLLLYLIYYPFGKHKS